MRIYVDLASLRIIQSPGFISQPPLLEFKRGASSRIEVVFVLGTQQQSLSDTASGEVGLKALDDFDGDLVVSASGWVVETNPTTGLKSYIFQPDFNTTQLNELLGHDGASSNDEPFVELMFEISWVENGFVNKTQTLLSRVYNDVLKGSDAIPSSGNPVYPPAGEIRSHIDSQLNPHGVTKAQVGLGNVPNLAAADFPVSNDVQLELDKKFDKTAGWEAIATGSKPSSDIPNTYPLGKLSVMPIIYDASYPNPKGVLITDSRSHTQSSNESEIRQELHAFQSGRYETWVRNATSPFGWSPWRMLLADGTTRNEPTEYSDELKSTGNDLSDPEHVVNIGQMHNLYGNPQSAAKVLKIGGYIDSHTALTTNWHSSVRQASVSNGLLTLVLSSTVSADLIDKSIITLRNPNSASAVHSFIVENVGVIATDGDQLPNSLAGDNYIIARNDGSEKMADIASFTTVDRIFINPVLFTQSAKSNPSVLSEFVTSINYSAHNNGEAVFSKATIVANPVIELSKRQSSVTSSLWAEEICGALYDSRDGGKVHTFIGSSALTQTNRGQVTWNAEMFLSEHADAVSPIIT